MTMQFRSRQAPDPMWAFYKENTAKMRDDPVYRSKIRDKAAYIHVTGYFPSHLRQHSIDALKPMTRFFRRPTSLDGRVGHICLRDEVVADLEIGSHPLVRKVQEKIAQGYLIRPSRGQGTRRNFWKIFMFKQNVDGVLFGPITVQNDTSIKEGW